MQKPAACAAGFVLGREKLIFARAGLRGAPGLGLAALFDKLHQAVDQATAAADHVQAAFVLVLLEDVIDLVLQFRHWKTSALRYTYLNKGWARIEIGNCDG